MTKQQQIDTLQKQLDAANEQLAAVDNALKEQYYNTATNIISEIKSWFKDQSENCTIFVNYDDVYKYLDNLRNVIEATAPNYTPSVLCELSMALSETRRQLAEQRIQHSAKYFGGKLPKTPLMQYGDEVVDYALKQQQEEQMKTEQEIKQMANTCTQYHSCALCPYNPEDISRFIGDRWKGGCPDYDRKLVYAMGKGYGDVSEYKDEIERLKADYAKLQEQFSQYQMASDKEIKAQVKQAKLDVLNELKTHSYFDDYYIDSYIFVGDIDELIEEVENDNSKSN